MSAFEGKLSPLVEQLAPSGIRRFFDLASQMDDVISLGVGEPDFVTPWHVREACFYALERGYTTYTANAGLPALREAIAQYLETFDLSYDPKDEVLVTVGGSEAIDLALRAVIQPGDEVLIPEPAYVSYEPCAILAGATVKKIATHAMDQFRLTEDALRAALTKRSKVLILCAPNNPTGAILDRAALAQIASVAIAHDLLVISDEIYAELTYGVRHVSIASLPGMKERTIVISGMSKAYAMTGWRIGYATAPRDVLAAMVKIHQYTMLCAPIMGQMAALEALRNGERERQAMVEQYDQRRRFVVKRLREIGLACHEPQGAFYAFPDIRASGLSSEAFAEQLLKVERVAVVPGAVFGPSGEGFVRCSYATSLAQLERAFERMDRFLNS
ncbi:aminotransferase class I/II-fold pyridoxal phosphate-dependent enzyme [Ferroacidibacillus organovorans]|uniref:Aminotransferase n=2 Tax=Ferroacidibacillus organovorans TaxID=1765683 RepID=A0A853KBD5_9BACL|nr:aminotransferase class I/II-fold pyridoxal phosphate-dependent enzyme [Ferroacidibacillus organovorans]KYP80597.1 aromatic amino acid aminotransferase [Ferroacidibacillus organovorans]OAG89463.1 aromatic amino acid aminotransferase [Ferroacidibacillus organovorans]